VAIASATLALIVKSTGGFNVGSSISLHSAWRPALAGALALVGYIAAGGRFRFVAELPGRLIAVGRRVEPAVVTAPTARIAPALVVGLLVVGTFGVDLGYGAHAVGGSDSYGYLSEAYLWMKGQLRQDQSWVQAIPLMASRWVFTPLGYGPFADTYDLVPSYAPGLPLLMAGAMTIGGYRAAFVVVPVSAALAVLVTFLLGRRVHSPWAGVAGAWLLATSPTFLMQSLSPPMSDVPVTAAWALAFLFVLGRGPWPALFAGLTTGFAVLVRLNLAPLALVPGLWCLVAALRDRSSDEARWWRRPVAFAAGVVPMALVAAAVNSRLYESPFRTGYGDLSLMFSWDHIVPNMRQYASWLTETQTVAIWIGGAAILLPLPLIWRRSEHRAIVVGWAAFVLALWAEYCLYARWDAWWYLRFLLPAYPMVMIGLGQVFVAAGRRHRLLAIAGVIVVIGLGYRGLAMAVDRGIFTVRVGESKYVMAARVVREVTEPASAIFSSMHSGSLRLYAGRMTVRYDLIDRKEVDDAVEYLSRFGIHSYALLEDAEVRQWRTQFDPRCRLRSLNWKPLRVFDSPTHMSLYDLASVSDGPSLLVQPEPSDLGTAPPIPISGFDIRR
jgi:hypothetical protein